ncbi:MAG TPA: Na/Pi symporter [Moheibacter sp.]|nr:Na/Pi symporter [Moheibacter sp.]
MLENFQTLIIVIAAITLFVYGLQNFSKEIEQLGIERLSQWIGKITAFPLGGFFLGGIFTSIIQSSTLVSSLTVSLVNSGVITFRDSILILLGTNVGTTSTAWIVSMESSFLGPFFIVLGTLISMIPNRISVAGKSIFYFGFIFFSLSFISEAMEPLKNDPLLVEILSKASNPLLGILYGILITVIIQSSSVVVGLVIVLLSQGTIDIQSAIPIVIGANIGTTSTALLISLKFSPMSKLVALSASVFNLVGVAIMFPFFGLLEQMAISFSSEPSLQVAIAFTISNAFTSVLFLLLLNPTLRVLKRHRWYKASDSLIND